MNFQPSVLLICLFVFFSSILGRLFWLQVIEGSRYRELSDQNRIRLVARTPVRGRLLDRKGSTLVTNKLIYNLYLEPRLLEDTSWPALRDRLSKLLNISKSDLQSRFQKGFS